MEARPLISDRQVWETGGIYTKISYADSTGAVEYICEAKPGNIANVASPIWRIRKFVYADIATAYGTIHFCQQTLWAGGSPDFKHKASDYATLSYS